MDNKISSNAMSSFLQISAVVLLIGLCLWIVAPFVTLFVWAVIIAVAVFPLHQRLAKILGRRNKLAATLLVLTGVLVIVVPSWLMTESSVTAARNFGTDLQAGTISIAPPSDSVADWPLIGKSVHSLWTKAASDMESAVNQFRPQFAAIGEAVLRAIGATVFGVLQFIVSIFIAGVLLLSAESGYKCSCTIATALAGTRGTDLTDMSIATIRSVSKGVVGVAIIQALFSGVGLVAVGVPVAGIWAAVVLVLAVMQLSPLLVLGPIAVWVFSVSDPVPATIFAIYAVIVSVSDSFLKPMFMGRGMDIPMLVILIGAIGGAISGGLQGLFLGPAVLAVGYKILIEWMATHEISNKLQSDQQ